MASINGFEEWDLSSNSSSSVRLSQQTKTFIDRYLSDCLQLTPILVTEEHLTEANDCTPTDEHLFESIPDSAGVEAVKPLKDEEEVVLIQRVLSRNVFGMTLSQLMDLYKNTFDRDLSSGRFRSIVEMIAHMVSHKVIGQLVLDPNDDIEGKILYDIRYPAPPLPKIVKEVETKIERIPESELIFWFKFMRNFAQRHDIKPLDVDYEEYGFKSKLDFFERLSEQIPIRVLNSEFKSQIKLKSLPEIQEFVSKLVENKNQYLIRRLGFFDDWLDVTILGDEIPVQTMEQTYQQLKNQIKPVFISYVKTWKRFAGVVIEKNLTDFWDDIDAFYKENRPEYQVPKDMIVSGLVCAVKCPENGWIRCRVMSTPDFGTKDEIKLLSIDFRYDITAQHKDLRLLLKDFAIAMVRTVRLRLHGVKNLNKKTLKEYLFKHRQRVETTNSELFCQFVGLRDKIIEAIIFETDDMKNYYSIGQQLCNNRLAQMKKSFFDPNWDLLYNSVQHYYKNTNSN